ncbi:MAG: GNAT family N-acetyltransferase [Gammaproteobacteria bacterium]
MKYREMEISDYGKIISLWQEAEGVKLRKADSLEGIEKYLKRNPGLSFVAEKNGEILGTIMSGHDGKRGYIQHLAVETSHRETGIASKLLSHCLGALKKEGILKSHIHVLSNNELAKKYWQNRGWVKRQDIEVYSYINGGEENT